MEIQYRRQLVDLMRELKLPLIAAELGVAEGLFSRDLLAAGLDKLYSVDAWEHLDQSGDGGSDQEWHDRNYNNVLKLLKPFGDKSILIKGISYHVADKVPNESLGLVYVDCDHSYFGVTNDGAAWLPKLINGGIMAFHDYESPQYGVKKGVADMAKVLGVEVHLISEDKPEDAGAWFQKI